MATAIQGKIPFVDLAAQYRTLRHEIDPAIQKTLEETAFIQGDRVRSLERDFAAYCGAKFGVGSSSGTSALHVALLTAGVGPGDEVITVSHTFIATVESIIHAGGNPVFGDVDLVTIAWIRES
jgi:dTDP-4-amino-4,6-dideoxygalactose transaminase